MSNKTFQQIIISTTPSTISINGKYKVSISIPEDSYYGTEDTKYFTVSDNSSNSTFAVAVGQTFTYETGDTTDQTMNFSGLPKDTIINIVYCN